MAIDVGPAAIDRPATGNGICTLISVDNPANATGTIDHIDIYGAYIDIVGGYVGSYVDEGSLVFSTHGTTGKVLPITYHLNEYDAPGDFTAFAITSGDYLGFYQYANSTIDRTVNTGGGCWYKGANHCPCTSQTFEFYDSTYSVYATGVETGAGNAPTSVFYGPLVGPFGGPI